MHMQTPPRALQLCRIDTLTKRQNAVRSSINNHYNYRNVGAVVAIVLFGIDLAVHNGNAFVAALAPCNTTDDCNQSYRSGSECIAETGYCSNVFYKKGCLANLQQQQQQQQDNTPTSQRTHVRVCSSADPPEAEKLGYCIPHDKDWNYTEIRLLGNNWESIFFETWILQILLSEMLGVPTSVDTGYSNLFIDFYDEYDRFDYGKAFDWDALRLGSEVGDCRLVKQPENESEYKSCGHVILEVWEGHIETVRDLHREDVIEKPTTLGVLADEGWFIPKFTGARDPTLTSYLGLMGDENRQKLANTFKRPTTWIDYCTEVSETNCTVADDVALRPPSDAVEENQFFSAGLYTGYFRKTEENDCELWPDNCTGHFVDYPCGWPGTFEQQTYHLKIALRSSGSEPYCRGYPYSNMVEIWNAANATKSDVMIQYWAPEGLMQTYAGSDAEFFKVALPMPTQECFEKRIKYTARCSPNITARRGEPEGACDDKPQQLLKAVTSNLYAITNDPSIPEALRSPAYEAIKNFQITRLQLGVMFDYYLKSSTLSESDTNATNENSQRIVGPREAVCQWVVENYDLLQTFIPRTYPRMVVDGEDLLKEPMFYVALIIAVLALLFVICICGSVYMRRKRRAMIMAQVEFLALLLCGLVLVQLGSVALSLPPSNASCVIAAWTVNLGYTLELVPLIVKVAAMNSLLSAARQMKRAKVNRSRLFLVVAGVTSAMAMYLGVWTILDPPNKSNVYVLTEDVSDDGLTTVELYSFCQSEAFYWSLIALSWRSVLLFLATVLAFQNRNSPMNFNESKTLAVMLYSQFSFLVWTLVLYVVQTKLGISLSRYQSLIQSIDVTVVLCIYFLPKLFTTDESLQDARRSSFHSSLHSSSKIERSSTAEESNVLYGLNFNSIAERLARECDSEADSRAFSIDHSSILPTGNPLPLSECHPTMNDSTNFQEQLEQTQQKKSVPAVLSHFELLADHLRFCLQYENRTGKEEIVTIECFDDPTKSKYYREERQKLFVKEETTQHQASDSNYESKSASHVQNVSSRIDEKLSTVMVYSNTSSSSVLDGVDPSLPMETSGTIATSMLPFRYDDSISDVDCQHEMNDDSELRLRHSTTDAVDNNTENGNKNTTEAETSSVNQEALLKRLMGKTV